MKKTVALILALVMALALVACGNGGSSGTEDKYDAYAEKFGTIDGLYRSITLASRMDIEHLQPTAGTGTPKNEFYWNIYETLFDFNEKNELVSDLAKDYIPSEDGLYWDILLYETIKDSKGNAITAEDVVSSFDWLIGAGEALNYEDVDKYEAVDTYTFRLYWKHAPESVKDYEFPLCRTYIFDSQYKGSDFAKDAIATGNYIVAEFVTGNHLTLWANKNYWALNTTEDVSNRLNLHKATVQMMTWEIIQESSTAEVALEKGTIDYCDYINQTASIEKFKTKYADKYNVETITSREYSFMELNFDESNIFANDENLRLAIYYAIDSSALAAVMGSSYLPMQTLGHDGFDDFDPAWNTELKYYCGEANVELAKDYLSKSSYDGRDFTIMCKSSEIDKNAAVSINAQLMAIGINCHLAAVDPTIFQTSSSDPKAWDLLIFTNMGGTTLVGTFGLPLGDKNTNADGSDKWSLNFIRDNEMVDLLKAAQADATHDDEHMKTFIDYVLAHGYIYPMAYSSTTYIYSKNIASLYTRETVNTPAAHTYAGQTKLEETAKKAGPSNEIAGVDPSAWAGSYTFSEPGMFGNKENDFTLTLNADGTYRLDCNNSVGENIYTEGTFAVTEDGLAQLSASPVMGDMDKLLNSGWADADNPAPTFRLNKDGTMVPEGLEAPEPAEPAPEPEPVAEEVPGIITGLEANGFERFTFYEDNPMMGRVFTWYVMKSDGMVIVVTPNEMFGTEDGLGVWHFTEQSEEAGVLTLSGLEEADKALPTMGDQWSDKDNFVQQWTIFGPGQIRPANMNDAAAYEDMIRSGKIPGAAPAEQPADEPAAEVPGIVNGLTGMGFECFTFEETTQFGTFMWYVLKGPDKAIVVTVNPNLDVPNGEAVWHFDTFTEDKSLMTFSDIEEADKALPTMGAQWTDKDNFVQQWQITGQGTCQPANMEAPAPQVEPAAEEEVPGIVTGLEANGFERFTFYEDNPMMNRVFVWYVMKSDNMIIVITPNEMLGTEDGLGVWHFTEFSEEAGVLTLKGIEEADKALPTMGDQWTDKDNFVQQWTIFGPGQIRPTNMQGDAAAYEDMIRSGNIPGKN